MGMLLAILLLFADPVSGDRAEAYWHFSLGLQALIDGTNDVALSELRRAQKLDPESSEIR